MGKVISFGIGADTKQLNSAVNNFVKQMDAMTASVNKMSAGVNKQTGTVSQRFSTMGTNAGTAARFLDRDLARALDRTNVAAAGLGTTIGVLAGNLIRSLGSALKGVSRDIIQVTRDFEGLYYTLRQAAAIDLVDSGAYDDLDSAIVEAGRSAQNTLLILEKLAIDDPFRIMFVACIKAEEYRRAAIMNKQAGFFSNMMIKSLKIARKVIKGLILKYPFKALLAYNTMNRLLKTIDNAT